jgi:hypothetical protein
MMNNWFAFLLPIFGFVLLKTWMDHRAKRDGEKLRVLEEALRIGGLDDAAKQELMQTLTGRRPAHRAPGNPGEVGIVLKLLAFVGWLALCVGIAFVILVVNFRMPEELGIAAAVLPCVGFGLVTYPFVVRELQATPRRHATNQQRV